ncbi:hypothetical protein ABZS29_23110 [Kribbella sp. NPDC005582]|uniref:hypothetical protein n=1 Tax=Kribbella sp. NPDC005582 TaxID=3156893 RepID=UPI0033B55592
MSTVDPIVARRAKRLSRAGRPGLLVGAIIAGVAQLGAALCTGLAIGSIVDLLRDGLINSVFADNEPGTKGFLGLGTIPVLFIVGTFGLIVAAATAHYLLDLYRGGEKQLMLRTPAVLWAVALGLFLDSRSWTDPLAVGTAVDPVFHEDDDTWGTFTWVMYRADIWLPVLAVVIAALTTVYAIRHNRRLSTQIADRNRLLAAGRTVTGTITNIDVRTSQNDQGHRSVVGADVIVKFTDLQGTDRWVTRRTTNRSEIPTATTATQVLFDPLHPEDDNLIFVAFYADPRPGDWIGTIA